MNAFVILLLAIAAACDHSFALMAALIAVALFKALVIK